MIRRPPRSTQSRSSAASDVYKRQDPEISPFIPSDRIEETGCHALVLVPVYSRERVLGLMVLFHHKDRDELEKNDMNLVEAIAGQAAVALENTSLYEDLEMSYLSLIHISEPTRLG